MSSAPDDLRQDHGRLAADIARSLSDANTDAVQAAALLDVLWASDETSILRAIDLLEAIRSAADHEAVILSDIAAAHLVRAELTDDPRAPLAAVEAAMHALELDPDLVPARFNLALALQWSGLTEGARQAWLDYLDIDAASDWAHEARRRADSLAARAARRTTIDSSSLSALAKDDPQLLRDAVWDSLLGAWGAAIERSHVSAADRILRSVHEGAVALSKAWNDESLLQVHAALASMDPHHGRTRRTAALLARHGTARRLYLQGKYDSAGSIWDELHLADSSLPALNAWVTIYRAATLTYRLRTDESERLIRRVLADSAGSHSEALIGRARWILGTTLLRTERTAEALALYELAEQSFDAAGERLNAASTMALQADARFVLGDERGALAVARRALRTLSSARPTVWHHNLLYVMSQAAARRGSLRAARAIADEDVLAAATLPVAIYESESRIARATLARLVEDSTAARRDLVKTRSRIDTMTDRRAAAWLGANLLLAEAALAARSHPAAATAKIDTAIRDIPARDAYRRLPALALRARSLLEQGSIAAALDAHRQAVGGLENLSAGVHETGQRLILLGDIRRMTEELADRLLQEGDTVGALAVIERERSRVGERDGGWAATGQELRAESVVLAISIVNDRVVVWSLAGSTVSATTLPGEAALVVRAVEEVNRRLELSLSGARTDSLLQRLYDWLIRGALPALEGVKRLIIVADGEIADAPFAALRDRQTDRFLIQDVELSFAPSVRALRRSPGRRLREGGVTVVGVSAVDRVRYPALVPLRHVDRESRTIASLYQNGQALLDGSVKTDRVIEALKVSRVVHLAAHAISDPADPLESHVVLGANAESDALTARSIATMSLDRLELVVLAACETQRGWKGRAGGLAGLTWSFLRAGAGGVVGSTWRVDDEATSILMSAMHRRYAKGEPAAAALRAAQLEMLESTDQRWRSPTYWAAFRYASATVH